MNSFGIGSGFIVAKMTDNTTQDEQLKIVKKKYINGWRSYPEINRKRTSRGEYADYLRTFISMSPGKPRTKMECWLSGMPGGPEWTPCCAGGNPLVLLISKK